jgi:hypothetical protein
LHADVLYRYDDGSFETQNGNNFSGFKSLLGIHQYDVLQGANKITAIQVAWPSVGLVNGDASSVILWNDPNLDGNPSDAQLLITVPTTIQSAGTGTFVSVDIPDTVVGNSFFVGTLIEKSTSGFMAGRMIDNTPPSSGKVWAVGFLGASANLNNLSAANNFIRITSEQYGIRAVGIAVPEANSMLLLLLGSGFLYHKNRVRRK